MRGNECQRDLARRAVTQQRLEVPPRLYRDVRIHFYSACIVMVIGMFAVACLL